VNDTINESTEAILISLGTPSLSRVVLDTRSVHMVTINDNDPLPSPSPTALPPFTAAERFAAARTVIQQKCIGCHSTFNYASDTAWIASGYVVPANLGASPLFARIAKNGLSDSVAPLSQQNMPPAPAPTLSTTELSAMRVWIEQLPGAAPVPAIVQWESSSLSITENAGTVSISASLDKAAPSAFTLPFSVGGSSTRPADHNLANGTLSYAAGATKATVAFQVVDDSVVESMETLTVTLGTPSSSTVAKLGTRVVFSFTIGDNDVAPPPPAPSPTPSPKPSIVPSPSPSPKPSIVPSPSPSPKPSIAPSPSPTVSPLPPLGTPAQRFSAATGVIQQRCLSCHSNFNKADDTAWIAAGYVKPGDLTQSNLFKRLAGNGLSTSIAPLALQNMPPLPFAALSTNELTIMREWIVQMPVAAPSPVPAPPPIVVSSDIPADSRLRLGDRRYVTSVLKSVFGESTEVNAYVSKLITRQVGAFGGPRDPMNTRDLECLTQTKDGVTTCAAREESQITSLPGSTTAREAYRTRACSSITNRDIAIRTAIAQVRGLSFADAVVVSTVTAPTLAELGVAYELFYAARPPASSEIITALKALYDQGAASVGGLPASKFEGWRFVFYALCTAPDWQAP
jgi:hypothetical protein